MESRDKICTVFGLGHFAQCPGTLGSLVGLIFALNVRWLDAGVWVAICVVAFMAILGTLAVASKFDGDKSEIVIDEVVGQFLTLMPVIYSTNFSLQLTRHKALSVLTCFALFRLFDISKPWPISWVQRHCESPFGVMADDILAAIMASCTYFVIKRSLS